METPAPTQPDGEALREAAASAITGDPITADLLARHSAGEKLSQSGYGKIGAMAAKAKRLFTPSKPKALDPVAAAVAPNEASPGGVVSLPCDPGLSKRFTATVLRRCDAVTVRWIESEARLSGATGPTFDRFSSAAALPPDDQKMIVELSPDIFAELGIDVAKFPILAASAVLGLHVTNVWLAVDELRKMRQTAPAPPAPSPAPASGAGANG